MLVMSQSPEGLTIDVAIVLTAPRGARTSASGKVVCCAFRRARGANQLGTATSRQKGKHGLCASRSICKYVILIDGRTGQQRREANEGSISVSAEWL